MYDYREMLANSRELHGHEQAYTYGALHLNVAGRGGMFTKDLRRSRHARDENCCTLSCCNQISAPPDMYSRHQRT